MRRLDDIVQRLARPIEFASRDSCANLPAVKNLGPFVSHQGVQALADNIYPSDVEADLLSLRQLFANFDEGLDAAERQHRLAGARAILNRLKIGEKGESRGAGSERLVPPAPGP